MRNGSWAGLGLIVVASLALGACQMITEAMPGGPDGLTPTPTTKPGSTPTKTPRTRATATARATETPEATATATPEPTETPTPTPEVTPAPEGGCPDSAPAVKFVNGSNECKPYVPASKGNCGVDSTWWYDCDDFYFVGAVYEYIGGGDPWHFVGQNTGAPCFVPGKTYKVGAKVTICSKGGATSCDPDHMVNPGMIACCRNHVWDGDDRRVVISAVEDATGLPLTVKPHVAGNPSFGEIVILHPGQSITVTYCLPPPPLVESECGVQFPWQGSGCTTKTFTPR